MRQLKNIYCFFVIKFSTETPNDNNRNKKKDLPIMLTTRGENIRKTISRAKEHRQTQQIVFYLLVATELADLIQNMIKIHFKTILSSESVSSHRNFEKD